MNKYVTIPLESKKYEKIVHKLITIDQGILDLTLYIPFGYENIDRLISRVVGKIKSIILFFKDYFKLERFNIRLFVALNQEKKDFPINNVIDLNNVNNGVTTFYKNGEKSIYIYRYEDLYKVLIHELIHYFHLDVRHELTNKHSFVQQFRIYDIEEVINMTEAYTEAMACYLYIKYKNKNKGEKALNISIEKYKIRFCRTTKALLKHFSKYNVIKQKSHMFSYYLCKTFLFMDIKRFINVYNMQIDNSEKIKLFMNFIESGYLKYKTIINDVKELKSMSSFNRS